jgi:hypothetical protein
MQYMIPDPPAQGTCTGLPPLPARPALAWVHDQGSHAWELKQGDELYASITCAVLTLGSPGMAVEVMRRVGSVPPPLRTHWRRASEMKAAIELIREWGQGKG